MSVEEKENLLLEGLNENQRKAVESNQGLTRVVAGAGSGKTKIISKRFVKIVKDIISNPDYDEETRQKPLEHILVITFTNDAASEMKTRIYSELQKQDIDYIGQDSWISTIHSFCNKILKNHAFEVGLSAKYKFADIEQEEQLYNDILNRIKRIEADTIEELDEICDEFSDVEKELNIKSVKNYLSSENLQKLIPVSDDISEILDGILPVIKKVKSLGLTPKQFLLKTYNAIKEYSETIKQLPADTSNYDLSEEAEESFLNVWADILKKYSREYINCLNNGVKPVFDLFNSNNKSDVLNCVIDKRSAKWGIEKRKNAWGYKGDGTKEENKKNYLNSIDKITELEQNLAVVIALVYAIYQKHLEKNDLVDFDDVVNKTLELFDKNEMVRNYYQKYFKHIIVDEFQDTNGAQMELMKRLIPVSAETGKMLPDITLVGDRKQSIYAFRYARMENLDILKSDIEMLSDKKYNDINLHYNYRSNEMILDVINSVTQNSLNLNENLYVDKNENNINRKIQTNSDDNSVVLTLISGKNVYYKEEEAKYISKIIWDRIYDWRKKGENKSFKDIAVLVYSHSQADYLDSFLKKYGIPTDKKSQRTFFKEDVILNCKAFFTLILNPLNDLALVRILQINFNDKTIFEFKKYLDGYLNSKIYDNTSADFEHSELFKDIDMSFCEKVQFFTERERNNNSLEIEENLREICNYTFELLNIIDEIRTNKEYSKLSNIFTKITSGRINPIPNICEYTELSYAKNNLAVFRKIISDFEGNEIYTNVSRFLDYWDKIQQDKDFELPKIHSEDIDAVKLRTIFASKGLEYEFTIVPDVNTSGNSDTSLIDMEIGQQYKGQDFGNFGLMIGKYNGKVSPKYSLYKCIYSKNKDYEENIRKFYVAVSRAKNYLTVIAKNKEKQESAANNYIFKLFNDMQQNKKIGKNITLADTVSLQLEEKALPLNINDDEPIYDTFEKYKNTERSLNFVPPKISFSSINNFNVCELKFFFQNICHYSPLIEGKSKNSILMGTLLHKLLNNSYINGFYNDKELENILNSLNIAVNDDIENKEEVLTDIKARYINYRDNCKYAKIKNYKSEYEIEYNFSGVTFRGTVDLLVKNDDETVTIVDFKTNTKMTDDYIDKYANQLYIYKKALEEKDYKVRDVILLHITKEEIKEISLLDKMDIAKDNISESISKLFNYNFDEIFDNLKKNNDKNCKYCGFKYLCKC